MQEIHKPVLLDQVIELLSPKKGEIYLDLTAGYGGHAKAIGDRISQNTNERLTLVDRDREAVSYLRSKFSRSAEIIQSDFVEATKVLRDREYLADMILLDLGVSGPQLENANRGFSFRKHGPLDMRMNAEQTLTADHIVNKYDEKKLADLIYYYGQEPASRRIASAIVKNRPIRDTLHLAEVVQRQFRSYKIPHPAQKVFQAIRIAVNEELAQIEEVMQILPNLLKTDGRVAVISFHSLEDKIVKNFIKQHKELNDEFYLEDLKVVKGKVADATNPRARSAILRAYKKRRY
jgi:16S rRNA (cytosine1402-N4)-methyltransferase